MAKFLRARTRRRCVSVLRCAVVIATSVLLVVGEDAWAASVDGSQPSSCAAAQPARLIREPHGPSFATQAQPQLTPEQIANRLEKMFAIVAEADLQIPRDTFDPQAIIDKTGKNPSKIFEWVSDHTYFVPYRGLLRGDKGVLMDRLGNSLDRAMLLYSLLQVAGQLARMAHGTLSETQAQDVLEKVRPFPSLEERIGSSWPRTITSTLAEQYAQENQLGSAEIRKEIEKLTAQEKATELKVKNRVATQTAAIAAAVGHPPASAAAEERADQVRAITDHWWVQWQNGGNWANLDPTLPASLPGQTLTSVQSTIAPKSYTDVGENLVHTVEINVVIEVWKQGQLKESTALKQKLIPAAVIGEPIVLRQIPVHWPRDLNLLQEKDTSLAFRKTALAQTEWLPVLNVGSHNFSQYCFNDSGDLNNPASPLAHAEEQGVGGLGGAIGGMLGSHQIAPAPKPAIKSQPGRLTAEWIDYVIQSPGKPAQTLRREIFDLIGPAERRSSRSMPGPEMTEAQRLERALSLTASIDILLLVAQPSPAFILHTSNEGLLSNRKPVLRIIRESGSSTSKNFMSELGNLKFGVSGQLNSLAFERFEWSNNQSRLYLAEPNILTYDKKPAINSDGTLFLEEGFDIVSNSVAPATTSNEDPFAIRLEQGILDTNAEAALAGPEKNVINTANAFANATDRGEKWIALKNSEVPFFRDSGLPKDAQARIKTDLNGGFTAVVPKGSTQMKLCPAGCWWRINARTGETLGLGSRGAGQTATEQLLIYSNAIWQQVVLVDCLWESRDKKGTAAVCKQGTCLFDMLAGTVLPLIDPLGVFGIPEEAAWENSLKILVFGVGVLAGPWGVDKAADHFCSSGE